MEVFWTVLKGSIAAKSNADQPLAEMTALLMHEV